MLIFFVIFPPIIFVRGYTLHKSVFFKNAKYIVVFGLIGTFLSFLVIWGLIYKANDLSIIIVMYISFGMPKTLTNFVHSQPGKYFYFLPVSAVLMLLLLNSQFANISIQDCIR